MAFTFRKAIRDNVSLLVGMVGGTGSGKTYSAMRLAAGISGAKPFAVIDTEAGRAKHYADKFNFDHGDLTAPFRPDRYAEAIAYADSAGYPVIVVDSTSHEHAGEGGLLDWHDDELKRMGGNQSATMAAWIAPKVAHKKFVQQLLQVRAHLILCFRAEEKVEMHRDERGKMVIGQKIVTTGSNGWCPVCEKTLPYELTASFLLTADAPGIPKPIKLQEQHRAIFPANHPIDEECGRRIAAWASSGSAPAKPKVPSGPVVSKAQLDELNIASASCGADLTDVCNAEGIDNIATLPAASFPAVMAWINQFADAAKEGAR